MKVDDKQTLSYTIDPEDTKDKTVTWSSSNESIAKVNEDTGVITGVNEGDCTVTVKTVNGKTDACEVSVLPSGPDLRSIYYEYCSSTFSDIASDDSYLTIDTNPSNRDDYIDWDAYNALQEVNNALGLPSSVLNKMNQTRSLDGMQSYSTDELEVSWNYHPDQGLEVIYALK